MTPFDTLMLVAISACAFLSLAAFAYAAMELWARWKIRRDRMAFEERLKQ